MVTQAEEEKAPLVAPSAVSTASKTDEAELFEYTPPQFFSADSSVPKWLQAWISNLYIFITIHYNFWVLPFLIAFYVLYQRGYGLVVVAILALYAPSFLSGVEKTAHGRPWDLVRMSRSWLLNANAVGIKIFREQDLDATKRYIFGFHPHGIIILSRIATYGGTWEAVFPKIITRALGASSIFGVPLARELCLWLGVVDASRSTADKVLKKDYSICVYPGGVPEIFLVDPESKETTIVLKERLGFVKLAIRHGAELVPTFVFGEKWFFNVWNPPKSVISFFRKVLKIPIIVFWGRFMWMPKRLPEGKTFGVVYGKPIVTTQKDEPTEADIRAVHALYVAEIERIFEQYKAKYGYDADEKLVIT